MAQTMSSLADTWRAYNSADNARASCCMYSAGCIASPIQSQILSMCQRAVLPNPIALNDVSGGHLPRLRVVLARKGRLGCRFDRRQGHVEGCPTCRVIDRPNAAFV